MLIASNVIVYHYCRKNPPAPETLEAIERLCQLSDTPAKNLPMVDPIKDLKKTDLEYFSLKEEFSVVEQTMNCYTCVTCSELSTHVSCDIPNGSSIYSIS